MEIDGWHGFMVKIITEKEGRCGIDRKDYMRYVAKMVFRWRLEHHKIFLGEGNKWNITEKYEDFG